MHASQLRDGMWGRLRPGSAPCAFARDPPGGLAAVDGVKQWLCQGEQPLLGLRCARVRGIGAVHHPGRR